MTLTLFNLDSGSHGRVARALFGAALGFLASACSDLSNRAEDRCAELRDQCLSAQKACVVRDDKAVCEPCKEGQFATASGSCEAIPGTPLSQNFAEFTVKAGEEITLTRHGEPVAVLVAPGALVHRRAALAMDAASHLAALLEESRRAPLPEPSLGAARAEALVEELRADRTRS